ncbi:hypothetical protein KUCAC02_022371 [Chaenocephalus aceratus]|uniref:Uncharacterized protein n=1 Tax=Chaenocephalus aceratus TaxID=36190 RepID=A0ACB9XN41_CHAAC|nr:hypothetical protein KUCAC02_022371 [Chaenocephalus aceratus]
MRLLHLWFVLPITIYFAFASSTTGISVKDGLVSPAKRWRQVKGGGSGHHGGHGPDRRYAMVLFRITSVFYMLWLPYIIYFLLESSHVLDSPALSFITTWLAISNSFCNCVIYSLSNSVFRLGMRRLSQTMCSFSHCAADDRDFGEPKPRKRANSCSI